MRVAVENILLINFFMDFCLLVCAIRPKMRIKPMRLVVSAAISAAASSCLMILEAAPAIRTLSGILLIPAMLIIACGRSAIRTIAGPGAALVVSGAMTAALIPVFPEKLPCFAALFTSVAITYVLLTARRKWLSTWDIQVAISFGGKIRCFSALVDTGNRLTEPVSGLSVMIVSKRLVEEMLPDGFEPSEPWRTLPRGFRLVAYGGVGGAGELGCFMPDEMSITASGKHICKTSSIWIAVYPGNLPGKTPALAPISAIQ